MNKKQNLACFIETLHNELPALSSQYGVTSIEVFGSYARQQQSDKSDLDLLVTFHETPGLLKFVRLENHLSDLLGIKVDLVMKNALKPGISQHVIKEAIAV